MSKAFIIEAGFTRNYYAPHKNEVFTSIQWEAKIYTSIANAKRAIYAMQFNPTVKRFKHQGIELRARPLTREYIQLSLFEVNP